MSRVENMADRFSDKDLILLISQPRAGSTLLQRILAGHPDVHTTAEPWLMLHPVYALKERGQRAEYEADLAFSGLRGFLGTLDGGDDVYCTALRRMGLLLYGTACEQAGKTLFLDKTPRYYLIIPELARIFPEASFIIILRNPLAVLASILNTWVRKHWILLGSQRLDLLEAPQKLLDGLDLLGDRATVVHYEQLVSEPDAQVRELCARLGLGYRADMLDYGLRPGPEGELGDPTGVQAHTRPSPSRLEDWAELGRERQSRHFLESYLEALGPDLLARLGYDYSQLKDTLQSVPCEGGSLSVTWQELFEPNSALKDRLYLVELAMLEHRRLVYWLKKMLGGRWLR